MASGEVGLFGQALLEVVQEVGRMGGFGDVYKRECTDLGRRITLLSHLFEEIRDFKGDHGHPCASTSLDSSSCLNDLLMAVRVAKRLLLVVGNYDSDTITVSLLWDF